MASPELSRRVERTEDDLTTIFDTVLDIKETLDRHTEILADQGRILVEHGHELAAIREIQAQHGEVLAEILRRLDSR